MVATFLQQELADELKKIFKGFRLKNPQGEESELNIFEQLLPMPEPAEQEEIPPELLENGLGRRTDSAGPVPVYSCPDCRRGNKRRKQRPGGQHNPAFWHIRTGLRQAGTQRHFKHYSQNL